MATTRVIRATGLKATTFEQVASKIIGKGALRGIRIRDADGLTQDEFLRITIDGSYVLDGSNGADIVGTQELILTDSILANDIIVDPGAVVKATQRIPFHHELFIEYKRASAGTSGLDITILFELKS